MRFMTKGSPAAAVAAVVWALAIGSAAEVRGADELSFAQVRAIVEKNLKANPRYRDGDLIVRCDVEPIFNELVGLGYMPGDAEGLYDAFLPDMSLLIQMLRSDEGRAFMREIHGIEGAYDRLERLSWLRGGHEVLNQLIHSPDGVDQLRALTTAAGAEAVARQFPDDDRAKYFDRPTGHVHTAAQLLKHLERVHNKRAAQKAARKEAN